MGESNSPYFRDGLADGEADRARADSDPPQEVRGMDPEKSWSWMYKRGYGRAFGTTEAPDNGTAQAG